MHTETLHQLEYLIKTEGLEKVITNLLAEQKEEIVRVVEDKQELVKEFNGGGVVTEDMKNFGLIVLKDLVSAIKTI